MRYKKWWLLISVIAMIPGILSFALYGLKLSIDFTGGTLIELTGIKDTQKPKEVLDGHGVEVLSISQTAPETYVLKVRSHEGSGEIKEDLHQKFKTDLDKAGISENRFEVVGPSISKDITNKAFVSMAAVILAIVLFIAIAFRKVPKPASSWRFGISTIFALFHDVIILVGAFSLLGKFFNIEIDSLFVTAALTVVGFSVHDTIVVFDRIRENLKRHAGSGFEEVVDISIAETLVRSLNTSFTVLLVLIALFMFGGTTIKNFILALMIGVVSGTYSSIFNASPILVYWQNWIEKRAR